MRQKEHGEGPVTDADLAVERFVLEGLSEAFPNDAVLSEETASETDRSVPRLWCLDPIDGTREYAMGLDEWAVQLALVEGGEATLGVLALPGRLIWADRDRGAFVRTVMNPDASRPLQVASRRIDEAVAIHSRTRLDGRTEAILDRLGITERTPAGGIGFKIASMLTGRAHLYVYPSGGCKLWDTAAPAAIWAAAGGTVTDARGRPLRYDGPLRHEDGLVFAAPGLLDPVLTALR